MAWVTPKTDWATDDAVGTTDLNRIEGNIDFLLDIVRESGGDVASANNLDIDADNDFFNVTGTTAIYFLKTTGRVAGSRVSLAFNDTVTLSNLAAGVPANYAAIKIFQIGTGLGNVTVGAGAVLHFVYDGTNWRCTY